jgi:hypothetical protein
VITLGIDLAAQDRGTAACLIEWAGGCGRITSVVAGLGDSDLLDLIARADKAGIDSPFGWPDEFVDAIVAHRADEPWPGRGEEPHEFRRRLVYRETDLHVTEPRRPLSVSTDRIGVTAMRCAALLDELAARGERVDRGGAGKVVEVYPAVALHRWSLRSGGYKKTKGRTELAALVDSLEQAIPGLEVPPAERELCSQNDDAFDALVASLVARAAALGLTGGPPPEHAERARREGWIHVPRPGTLAQLTRAASA